MQESKHPSLPTPSYIPPAVGACLLDECVQIWLEHSVAVQMIAGISVCAL
jgi:hypothetical protein